MGDGSGPGYREVGGAKTGACVKGARTIDDDELGGIESEVDIVEREKQIDANSEIYYAIYLSENRTLMTPDKTNKIPLLISS